jgi:hypothetical protein
MADLSLKVRGEVPVEATSWVDALAVTVDPAFPLVPEGLSFPVLVVFKPTPVTDFVREVPGWL